ncbi:MAG: DUF805 domain-containing protein [Boseongicola sp.]|nr:DUF805 domain-containing protein [Boseongicola sp.]
MNASRFLSHYSFEGRASRIDCIAAHLLFWLHALFAYGLWTGIPYSDNPTVALVITVVWIGFGLGFCIPVLLAYTCRRCHDFGRTGWTQLLGLIPYINGVFLLVLVLLPGSKGDNRFGPVPPRTWIF